MHDKKSETHSSVIIVCPIIPRSGSQDAQSLEHNTIIDEAKGLCRALDCDIASTHSFNLKKVSVQTYLGKGQAERIKEIIEQGIDAVGWIYMDCSLTPTQQRNLEKIWQKKVIDRTQLILEIFADRAQTKEGRLQVELAQLNYQKSRLVRAWTHLERQRGGIGSRSGPGERQIELDRRMIDEKIARLKNDLEKVKKRRAIQRQAREKVPFPIIALVGYTNAGKSTLFNTLTKPDTVLAEDMLFATLDPTLRAIELPSGQKVIIADTVGFISGLPTELVAAFQATLEEVSKARLILHVQDISSPNAHQQAVDVEETLKKLKVDPNDPEGVIQVWNKIDQLEDKRVLSTDLAQQSIATLAVSAVTEEGLSDLLKVIDRLLAKDHLHKNIKIKSCNGKLINWLHRHSDIKNEVYHEDGMANFDITISKENWQKLKNLLRMDENALN